MAVPQILEDADKDDVESKEDEKEENLDWSFYDNLGLPEPNPLPLPQRQAAEPLRIIYDYSYRMLGSFEGAEGTEKPSKFDRQITIKANARIYREKMQESRLSSQMVDQEQSEEEEYEDPIETQANKIYSFFNDTNTLVYKIRNNEPGSFNILNFKKGDMKSRICSFIEDNGLDYAECYYQPKGVEDSTLVFESRFESGNLAMVSKVGENEYNLLLQNDINTAGYGQWFFFQVRNTRKDQKVKFNIINYRKNDSLHNYGLKVLTFSSKDSQKANSGWARDGTNITYGSNGIVREHLPTKFYRTLSWEYQFKNADDTIYFAYAHPYTYTNLVEYLDRIEADETKSRYFRRSTLCHTQAGNKCETITITYNRRPEDCERKQCIVLTARVHPGETCSSFVIQGVIDFLLSEAKEAQALRENFIFKIIPMLNPDGVIHGNSRCSFAGDLNRKWKSPSQVLHPTIYYAKKLIQKLHHKYKVAFFCDFHGHSKRKDIFIYGCQNVGYSAEARMFPWILSQTSPMFNYRRCTFHIHHSKFTTARAAVFQELKILNSCTVETSFFGSEETNCHYTANDLFKFGSEFCRALLVYFSGNLPCKLSGALEDQEDIEKNIFLRKEEMVKKFFETKENLEVGDNASDSGSDSAASDDDVFVEPKKVTKKSNSPRKNANTNAKKITPNRDTKALKALIEQKISLELEKTLTNKKEEEQKAKPEKPNKRLLKGTSFGTSVLERSPNLNPANNKMSQINIGQEPAGTKQLVAKNFLNKGKKPFADEYGLKEREVVPVKVHKLDNNINHGIKPKERVRGMDFVIAPNYESPDKKHKRTISLESRGDSNTQASTPRMPQQAFLPKMAVIENNFDQSLANRAPLKSRKNIHHIGFNKIRNSTQQEEFNRFLYNNSSLKRSPRHRLADINLSKEKYDVSLPNKSITSNNTVLFDVERRGKQSSVVFERVAEENLNISQISGEYIDEEEHSNLMSAQIFVQKRTRTKYSVSPEPTRKSEQQTYTATSLPVLQSLLGKIGQEDAVKIMNKETAASMLDSNMGASREEARYKGSPLDPRITYSTRQRFKILPKLLQYNYKDKV